MTVVDDHVTQGIEFGVNGVLEFANNGRIYFELPSATPDASCSSLKLNLVVDDVAAHLALATWAEITGATAYEVQHDNQIMVNVLKFRLET